MTFKMSIVQTKKDGSQNKIEIENSEAFQNQSELLGFLRPILYDIPVIDGSNFIDIGGSPFEWPEIELNPEDEKMKNMKRDATEPEKKPVINRPKADPPEKVAREYSDRKTGVVEIHCPDCGRQTAKHADVKHKYIYCPNDNCDAKLFLYSLNDVIGEPDELGVSFRANRIFKTAREIWEEKNGQ